MSQQEPNTAPLASIRHFSKAFGGVSVLRNVSFDVNPGEVHGLVGENGSGKSTLIKILAGFHEPERGAELVLRGERVGLPLRPGEARRRGLAFVHQDLALIESATVVENMRLGRYGTGPAWCISWKRERDYVLAALSEFGLNAIDPNRLISSLKPIDRALTTVAMAFDDLKVLSGGLLILDEATTYLPRDDIDRLFEAIRRIAANGASVLLVSHRIEEIMAVTDRVTVLRDGEYVATVATASSTEDQLVELILGFKLEDFYPTMSGAKGEIVLSVRDLNCEGVTSVSFDVREGEVLGLTGLLRSGYELIPYVLFGAERALHGCAVIGATSYELNGFSPKDAIKAGVALVPGDRTRDGGVGDATVSENLTLATLSSYWSMGRLRRKAEIIHAGEVVARFGVRPSDPLRAFGTLSGGNQQKVVVAKWLEADPKLLLLHEPTQGVDVGARAEIFGTLKAAATSGTAIVIASTEYEDLAHLCDRVLVLRDGSVVSEISGADLTAERIAEQALRPLGRTVV